MSKKRGTSSVPMIMGIIGTVFQLPGAVCSGACAAGLGSVAGESQKAVNDVADFYMGLGLVAALLGFICGLLGKRNPVFAGIGLLIAAILSGITLITFNFFSMVALILFLLGSIFAFVQKKEEVPEQ